MAGLIRRREDRGAQEARSKGSAGRPRQEQMPRRFSRP